MSNEVQEPSESSSGNGHGTYTGPEAGQETIDRPVLDGATETETETANVNPATAWTTRGSYVTLKPEKRRQRRMKVTRWRVSCG